MAAKGDAAGDRAREPGRTVVGTVECVRCRTGYVPTPDQTRVLARIRPLEEWTRVARRFALAEGGWYQRADGLLLCRRDAEYGETPLPEPITYRQMSARYFRGIGRTERPSIPDGPGNRLPPR